jgi:hypothetical protein
MDIEPSNDDGMSGLLAALGGEPEQSTEPVAEESAPADDAEEAGEPEAQEETDQPEADESTADVVDLDGRKIELPKGTPKALVETVQKMAADLKADHTRKTQVIAEHAKAVAAKEQLLTVGFERALAFKNAQDRVQQFGQIDWQSLADSDPAQATRMMAAYQVAQQAFSAAQNGLQQVVAQTQHNSQLSAAGVEKARQEQLAEGFEKLPKLIPGFNAAMAKKIAANTKTYGFNDDDVAGITDPRLVQALHDAAMWRELQSGKPQAMKKVAEAPKLIKGQAPQKQSPNAAAADRLKRHGRIDDLAVFL